MKEKLIIIGAYAVPIGKPFRYRQRWWIKTDTYEARALTSARVTVDFKLTDPVGMKAVDLPERFERCVLDTL